MIDWFSLSQWKYLEILFQSVIIVIYDIEQAQSIEHFLCNLYMSSVLKIPLLYKIESILDDLSYPCNLADLVCYSRVLSSLPAA